MRPKANFTHSQVAKDPKYKDHIPSTKVALMAGVSHSKIISTIVKSVNVLNEPLIERHGLVTTTNEKSDTITTVGYMVSPTAALLTATQFNAALRHDIIKHIQVTSPEFYDELMVNISHKPKTGLTWHKRITFAKPTEQPTADDFVRHSVLCTSLKLTKPKLYIRLIEAGLLKETPRDKIFGYKVTAIGMDYIREYRHGHINYFVFDKRPVIDILRTIAASKV